MITETVPVSMSASRTDAKILAPWEAPAVPTLSALPRTRLKPASVRQALPEFPLPEKAAFESLNFAELVKFAQLARFAMEVTACQSVLFTLIAPGVSSATMVSA